MKEYKFETMVPLRNECDVLVWDKRRTSSLPAEDVVMDDGAYYLYYGGADTRVLLKPRWTKC